MNWIKTKLLTNSKLLRYGAGLIVSLLMGWGAVKADNKEAAIGATTTLLTIAASAYAESKKDSDAKKVQKDRGLKPDGWIGPVSRENLTGVRPKVKPRGGNPKFGLIALALLPAFMFGGCAGKTYQYTSANGWNWGRTGGDITPRIHETAIAAKIVWTPVVLVGGVVTWIPVIAVAGVNANMRPDWGAIAVWPIYLTHGLWVLPME